jgi:Amt family ammonium transporter
VHGVGGILGTILLGVFATKAVNGAGADGLLHGGGGTLLVKQTVAALGSGAYAFIFTWGMLKLINLVTPVKVSASEEAEGLDATLHGEQAYV